MENRKKRILLFESSVFLLEVYLKSLIDSDFEVITIDNPEDVGKIAELNPDLIVLDIMSPKINGKEVLKHIKDDFTVSNIPIIIIASAEQEKTINELLQLGASGFLLKENLTPTELVKRMQEFSEEASLSEEQKNF